MKAKLFSLRLKRAKDYKSITEILEKKYQCKFYLWMDFKDVSDRIKQKEREKKDEK